MLRKHYDAIIIGSGPAGLFTAHELSKSGDLSVLVVDRGAPPCSRSCPISDYSKDKCSCKICGRVQGGGGAGLFSDGKLVLDLQSGGHLRDYVLPYPEQELLSTIEETLFSFDGKSFDLRPTEINSSEWRKRFQSQDLKLKTYPVRHFGSYNLQMIMTGFIQELSSKIHFSFNSDVREIWLGSDNRKYLEVEIDEQQITISTDNLILAVGKFGAKWLHSTLARLGIAFEENRTYLGVRLEVPHASIQDLLTLSLDPKIYHIFDDGTKIKTHCFCRHGQVIAVNYEGFSQVGGHTPFTENNSGSPVLPNSNFAVLLGDAEGLRYSKDTLTKWFEFISSQTNNKILVQRIGDLINKRSTKTESIEHNAVKPSLAHHVAPGNLLDFDIPLNFINKFLWFMQQLNNVVPGLLNPDNLIFAPALEWCMDRVPVDVNMQTKLPGVYAIGDGAGLSQGIVHAAATGILAGKHIIEVQSKSRCLTLV